MFSFFANSCTYSQLGLPRDKTSWQQSGMERLVIPGQKYFLVLLSRDKRRSKNTGTRWFVPGRPAGQNGLFLPINDVSEERKHDFYTENRINGQNKTPFGTHFGTPNAGLVI